MKLQPYLLFTFLFFSSMVLAVVYNQGSNLMRFFIIILSVLTIIFGIFTAFDELNKSIQAKIDLKNGMNRYMTWFNNTKTRIEGLKEKHVKLYWLCLGLIWFFFPIEMGIFTVISLYFKKFKKNEEVNL